MRGVNANLKTQQCVATTIWYSYFTYTTLLLREHWLSSYPSRKGLAFEMLGSDSSAIAGMPESSMHAPAAKKNDINK